MLSLKGMFSFFLSVISPFNVLCYEKILVSSLPLFSINATVNEKDFEQTPSLASGCDLGFKTRAHLHCI